MKSRCEVKKTNTPFWQAKIERNRQRDLFKRLQLRLLGWHTIILWECQLKPRVCDLTLKGLERTLNQIFLENYTVHKVKPYTYSSFAFRLFSRIIHYMG